jgi:hypothetical protein
LISNGVNLRFFLSSFIFVPSSRLFNCLARAFLKLGLSATFLIVKAAIAHGIHAHDAAQKVIIQSISENRLADSSLFIILASHLLISFDN